jgi:hypothetical protein
MIICWWSGFRGTWFWFGRVERLRLGKIDGLCGLAYCYWNSIRTRWGTSFFSMVYWWSPPATRQGMTTCLDYSPK